VADEPGEERAGDLEYKEGGLPIGLIIAGIISVAAVIFVVLNSNETPVDFLLFSATLPLSVVIIISMAFGAVLGWFLGYMRRRRKRRDA
jgi:lipopolysaccharide assembly protein A